MVNPTWKIRAFDAADMDDVLKIWLDASVGAHGFVSRDYWQSQIEAMRTIHIPTSETYVFVADETIEGFVSLVGDTVAALFVAPEAQGRGIGGKLLNKAKSLRMQLCLAAYRENPNSIRFYERNGFTILEERIDEHTDHAEVVMTYRPEDGAYPSP